VQCSFDCLWQSRQLAQSDCRQILQFQTNVPTHASVRSCIDGTHACSTGQCRNGGKLLDHFTDPLSFAYWLVGIAIACGRLDLGLAAVICLYATAVLTNIKTKLLGEFTLASFGPTEFKSILALFGMVLCILALGWKETIDRGPVVFWFFVVLLGIGGLQLVVNLVRAIRDVNKYGQQPDTTEWETTRSEEK
jgi:phosphatidylglycerophosphate synthase